MIIFIIKCGVELLIHFQTSTVAFGINPKFGVRIPLPQVETEMNAVARAQ